MASFFTIPNILSSLRIPLALLFFFSENILVRATVLILAMISDSLDGIIARYFRQESFLGTILDPITDKFFVLVALAVFLQEKALFWPQAAAFLSRDIALLLFVLFLFYKRSMGSHRIRAILCGKISTALQFFTLLALTFQWPIPEAIYLIFVLLGISSLAELYFFDYKGSAKK